MTALTLARNEWIKTTRRLAFWVTLLCLGALLGIMYFQRYKTGLSSDQVSPFQLPDGWAYIIGEPGPIPGIVAAMLMIMLVSSEFSWRTARQNVIDGLSRTQFYAGKAMLVPAVALALLTLVAVLGASFALPGTDLGASGHAIITRADVVYAGAAFLSVVGLGAMALLIASLVRSSGPAMALFFFYFAFGERILAAAAARFIPGAAGLMSFAPAQFLMGMTERAPYYPAVQEAAIARAVENGNALPTFPEPALLAGVALAWTTVFMVAGWAFFRRRDV